MQKFGSNIEHLDKAMTLLNELVKMLNSHKALAQEPCEDAISRETVKIEYKRRLKSSLKDESRGIDLTEFADCTVFDEFVDSIPPVTPQPKTGKWITKIKSDLRGDMWPTNPKCSECGGEPYFSNTIYNYKFCPYCGAKMESEE